MDLRTNETILMVAFKKGDPAAEAEVFRLIFKLFYLLADEIVHHTQVAEDIVTYRLREGWSDVRIGQVIFAQAGIAALFP